MRDYLVLSIVFSLLPVCVLKPYIGILVWSWISYMNPHRLTWGLAYDFPLAQLVAICTIFGFGLSLARREEEISLPLERETVLLLFLWIMFTITSAAAIRPEKAWPEWQKISKIFLMTFLTIPIINEQKKLRYLLLVTALSIGFYGLKGGIFGIRTGGNYLVWGPPDSFIADNNALALGLNMTLPILFYLAKDEKKIGLKVILLVTFPFSIISVLFTYSRGAFLGLTVVMMFFFRKLKLRTKLFVALLLVLLLPIVISQLPQKWFERIDTLKNIQEDQSAMSRLYGWKLAWRIAVDRPLTGGGFENMDFDLYYPDAPLYADVHSVYFEVLGECGFISFGLFVALLISSFSTLVKIRRGFQNMPHMQWLCNYCHMLEISIIAYAVTGAFLELLTYDLIYTVVAIVIILKKLSKKELPSLMENK